jgi:hypothetical protein
MLIYAIVRDDYMVLVLSQDFTKGNIGIKGEITNGTNVSHVSF